MSLSSRLFSNSINWNSSNSSLSCASFSVASFFLGVISTSFFLKRRNVLLSPYLSSPFSSLRHRSKESNKLSPKARSLKESKFTIFTWNDMYELEGTDGTGGLAESMTLLEEERSKLKHPNITTVNGDFMVVTSLANLYKGSHMINFFNDMKVDLVVPGNHEFDYGPEEFLKRVSESKFSWLGTNIRDKDGNAFPNLKNEHIIQVDDFKIGFFGICTDETKSLSFPGDTIFLDPVEASKSAIKNLREQGVNYFVALTHQWYTQDLELSKQVPDIDLILGGHDHTPITIFQGKTLIHKSGQNIQFVGKIDLTFQKNLSTNEVSVIPSWRMIANANYSKHPLINKGINKLMDRYEALKKDFLGVTQTHLDSKSQAVRSRETTMGNVMANSIRDYFQSEVAILQGGAIRGNLEYPAGSILTAYDIIRELPFSNLLRTYYLKGKSLKEALEEGVRNLPHSTGCFPQVSGCDFIVDMSQPIGQRIVDLKVNGKSLEPERDYKVASTKFISMGGDGYSALTSGVLIPHEGNDSILLTDLFTNYVREHKTISPVIEGRIKIIESIEKKNITN